MGEGTDDSSSAKDPVVATVAIDTPAPAPVSAPSNGNEGASQPKESGKENKTKNLNSSDPNTEAMKVVEPLQVSVQVRKRNFPTGTTMIMASISHTVAKTVLR
jgi:hypothetical protein